jgi:hypothetical protein
MNLQFYQVFNLAVLYPRMQTEWPECLAERVERHGKRFPYTERHLHCVWFDPRLRPGRLYTHEGEVVEVEHPGSWNLEAGPDFKGAILRVGSERRRMEGDAELHIRASDWKAHGHTGDPRFRDVRFHITYFPGLVPPDHLPQGTIQLSLQAPLKSIPTFAFEQIDLLAYPYEINHAMTPLRLQCKGWGPDEKMAFLDAAGEERLRRKTLRISEAIEERGADQVLYEEILSALGYKNNKHVCRDLARALPLEDLRTESQGDPLTAYALLLGVSHLMPENPEGLERDGLALIRKVWDQWWKRKNAWENRILDRRQWDFSAMRPTNHPYRRLMAAALIFTRKAPLSESLLGLSTAETKGWLESALKLLSMDESPFWSRHLSLTSEAREKPIALVGRARAISILTNVFVPFVAALQDQHPFTEEMLHHLPPEPENAITRQTAHALFGIDHSPALYKTGLRRQGLIQIFYDFGIG